MRFSARRLTSNTLKIGLTLLAFWFALHGVDFSHLTEIVEKQNPAWLVLAGVFTLTQMLLGSQRWWVILRLLHPAVPRLREIVRINYISIFFNICMPGTVGGDVVRVWLAKSRGIGLQTLIHSVIIDRMMALGSLGLIVIAIFPRLGALAGFNGWLWVPPMLAIGFLGLALALYGDRWLARWQQVRLIGMVIYFLTNLRQLILKPGDFAQCFITSLFGHLCYCITSYFVAVSLGLPLSFLDILTFVPIITFITMIPFSIGGWGIREAGFAGLFLLVGIPKAAGVMFALQLGLVNVVVILPAGIMWLLDRQKTGKPALGESEPAKQ